MTNTTEQIWKILNAETKKIDKEYIKFQATGRRGHNGGGEPNHKRRKEIVEMRNNGNSFKDIATHLGEKEEAVKAMYYRNRKG